MKSDAIERKFVEVYDVDDWLVQTDTGWSDISSVNKTIEYEEWEVETTNFQIICADDHILFYSNMEEVFAKDLVVGDYIQTQNGPELVKRVERTGRYSNMYDLSLEDDNHRFYGNGILSHNSITTVSYILWLTLFNNEYSVAILANKGALARELLERYKLSYTGLPMFLQQGVVEWQKGSISLENKSKVMTSGTSANSLRGSSINFLYCDEFAFVPNNMAETFFTSVYPVISSGVSSKITISSTSNGMNLFYKMWTEALAGRNGYKPVRVYYWQYPGREEGSGFKERTIAATSLRQWNQEFGCEFLGSTNTLIVGEKLASLVYGQEIKKVSGAIIYEEPIEEGFDENTNKPTTPHIYVITVDVSEGKNLDYSAFSVFDISVMPHRQVAVYRNNAIPPILLPSVIKSLADYYNGAYVLVEINNTPQVADLLSEDLGYENVLKINSGNKRAQTVTTSWVGNVANGLRMSPLVKRIGCSQLKTLVENDKIVLLDFETISELTTFVQQGPTFKAEEGRNDDLAMTLVIFAWLTTQKYFKDILEYDLRKQLQYEHFDVSDQETPIPITVDDGIDNRTFVEDGDLWTAFNEDNEGWVEWR